jgi:uncharacterized protein YjbJ (UPF0337 family)
MANQATLTGNWNELKGRVRAKWGQLTDDMLEQSKDNMDALVGTIQRTTGEAKDKIQEYLNIGAEQGANLYNQASDAVRAGTQQVVDGAKQVGDTVKAGADQASQLVQSRPLESLMFTFGAGIVAGLTLGLVLRSR